MPVAIGVILDAPAPTYEAAVAALEAAEPMGICGPQRAAPPGRHVAGALIGFQPGPCAGHLPDALVGQRQMRAGRATACSVACDAKVARSPEAAQLAGLPVELGPGGEVERD